MPKWGQKKQAKGRKRTKKRLPKTISSTELDALLAAPSCRSYMGLRSRAVMSLMGRCGLRVSEACKLKVSDLRMDDDPYARIIGKGDKERNAFFGPVMARLIEDYLEKRPQNIGPYLFPVIHNGPRGFGGVAKRGKALSRNSVGATVKRFAKKAGIRRHVHPHMLRHTFATQALRKKTPLRTIQEMLGHSDISTTAIYLQVAGSDMAEAAKKLEQDLYSSPLDGQPRGDARL